MTVVLITTISMMAVALLMSVLALVYTIEKTKEEN